MGRTKNTLQYESFTKKIAKVGGDAARWSTKLAKSSEGTESFLLEAITKWNDADHGQDFLNFLRDLPMRDLQTSAQVLHYKSVVVDALLKHLGVKSSHSLVAVIEVLMGAVRDYRECLDDRIYDILHVLLELAECEDKVRVAANEEVQLTETIFLAVTLVFKLFSARVAKELTRTLGMFLPLLCNKKHYLRRLAAETFSFVLRKTEKVEKLSHLAVCQVDDERSEDGAALLFFYLCRGVNKQLHSRAPQKQRQMLEGVLLAEDSRERGVTVCSRWLEHMAGYACLSEYANIIKGLLEFLDSHMYSLGVTSATWQLICKSVFHSKNLKRDPSLVAESLLTALEKTLETHRENYSVFLPHISTLTLSVWSDDEWIGRLRVFFSSLLSSCSFSDGFSFLGDLLPLPHFDIQLLPLFGRLTARQVEVEGGLGREALALFARICHERRPLKQVQARGNRHSFFDISQHGAMKKELIRRVSSLEAESPEDAALLLVVWPWLFAEKETVLGSREVVSFVASQLKDTASDADLLAIAISALFSVDPKLLHSLGKDDILRYVKAQGGSESAVQLLRLWLLARGEWTVEAEAAQVCDALGNAFLSPHSATRMAMLDCLARFHLQLPKGEDGNDQRESAFCVLLAAEREPLSLEGYRRRLMHLRKLSFPFHRRFFPSSLVNSMQHVPLLVLLSQFFEKFSLLWKDIFPIAETYARGMGIDDFWGLLKLALEMAAKGIAAEAEGREASEWSFFVRCTDSSRVDFISFRIQVFNFLATVADVAERRTKILSPVLLSIFQRDFMREEEEAVSVEEEEIEIEEGEEEAEEKPKKGRRLGKRAALSSLSALLQVFAKFSDPKSVYQEKRIRLMYDELLLCSDLQKVVLECLFTYKNKAIVPYKENLERLVGEKTQKDELVLFSIDEQDSVVEEGHRTAVIPLFLRLLLGMQRSRAVAKRGPLLAAVAGCRPDELAGYINILFQPILPMLGDTESDGRLEKVKTELEESGQLASISLSRIAWAVRSVSSLLLRLSARLRGTEQTLLLRLLCVSALLVHSAKAHFPIKALRPLRQAIAEALQKFFAAFPHRQTSEDELFLLQGYAIGCDVQRVESTEETSEGTAFLVPLSTLRLIASWTALPQLYSLLNARLLVCGESTSPLQLLCSSLCQSQHRPEVAETARTAFSNLLTFADEAQTNEGLTQLSLQVLPAVNLGTSLLVQQLHRVLSFLLCYMEGRAASSPSASTDLEILARLSPFISSPSHRSRFAAILLKQVVDSPRDSRLSTSLSALASFAPTLENPLSLIKSLAPLFSLVETRDARESLCRVLRSLAANPLLPPSAKTASGSTVPSLLELAAELDAWDGTKVDEPHYERRHIAFSKLNKIYSAEKKMQLDVVALLAHSHAFTLKAVSDVSLRSAASDALQELVRFVGGAEMEEEERRGVVDTHLVPLCIAGFAMPEQNVRDEWVRAFSCLVSSLPSHPSLSPLQQLHSTAEDGDLDFFLNIVHIQSHRRQRALFRLADDLEHERLSIPVASLLSYIVPLVQPWLLLSAEGSNASLSDEALHLLSAILSRAPWKKYFSMLEYWIRRLSAAEQQKPAVRVVVAILDAFHFDCTVETGSASVRGKVLGYLLPTLKACVDGKERRAVHAKAGNKKYYSEDDDLLRTPVALASTKLLRKLPQDIIDEHLNGLVLKMCSLLASRSVSVRLIARKTLVQMCECLGAKYLPFVIRQLKHSLEKGFQVHVMIFTVHTLICSMAPVLKSGDLDSCLDEVMEVCCADLFGKIAEEKEIGAIRAATNEAKHGKSGDTVGLLAKFVSPGCLGRLLHPLTVALDEHPTAKTAKIVSIVLTEIATGLKKNEGMDRRELLIYVHFQLRTNLAKLREKGKAREEVEAEEERRLRNPESCYILPKTPGRLGEMSRSGRGHAPVLLEFALQLLAALLAAGTWKEEGDPEKLDPFLPLLLDILQVKYDKVVCNSLRCVLCVLPLSLPSFPSLARSLADRLFVLLSNYAVITNNRHSILQLNQLLFKSIASLIRHSSSDVLEGKRLEILLSYIINDMGDSGKQATAFALLKSILQREMSHPQLATIMRRVEEMSIQSEVHHVRASCRQLLLLFVGAHPDGRDVSSHVGWLLAQLDYQSEEGRLSAVETLHSLFAALVQTAVDDVAMAAAVRLASRLVNEGSEKGRGMVALATRKLLSNVSEGRRQDAFLALCDWISNPQDRIRAAGASLLLQLCHIEHPSPADSTRLHSALPIVANALEWREESEGSPRTACLLLDCLSSLLSSLPDASESPHLPLLFDTATSWCKSREQQTRQPSARLLGQLLSLGRGPSTPSAWSLFEASAWQMGGKRTVDSELAKQVMKNMVAAVEGMDGEEVEKACIRLHNIARHEIIHTPNESIKRASVFKMSAAMALKMEGEALQSILSNFLPLLLREMSKKSNSRNVTELSALAGEVVEVLKKRAGESTVTEGLSQAAKVARITKDERKIQMKRVAAVNPEAAAAERIERQQKKKAAKKRRLDTLKPQRLLKRKRHDITVPDDE